MMNNVNDEKCDWWLMTNIIKEHVTDEQYKNDEQCDWWIMWMKKHSEW